MHGRQDLYVETGFKPVVLRQAPGNQVYDRGEGIFRGSSSLMKKQFPSFLFEKSGALPWIFHGQPSRSCSAPPGGK